MTASRVHDESYHLFALGANISTEVHSFLETLRTDRLEAEATTSSIFGRFTIPALHSGDDFEETTIFVKSEYSKVSTISRLIPSPDWFLGVEGVELCQNENWIDELTVHATLFDAGIGDGLTFTAPIFPTDPKEPVTKITPKKPNHAAASFYYPELKTLPALGMLHFQKTDEYTREECIQGNVSKAKPIFDFIQKTRSKQRRLVPEIQQNNNSTQSNQINDCEVSEWSEYTPCSKTCGLGEQFRTRIVLVNPKRGGLPCPRLVEKKWCGSAKNCVQAEDYFKWK